MGLLRKGLTNFICCFILNKEKREEFRKKHKNKRVYLDKIKNYKNNKPIEPYAFIRVNNEIITLRNSLESILPAIKKGVIGYNDCTDGSEEVILEFCNKNKGFIPIKYSYSIFSPADKRNGEFGNEKNKLYSYYNYVLSFIPEDEWLIKIDCDHIYDAEKLKKIFKIPKGKKDCVILPKINIDIVNGKVELLKTNGFNEVDDHWIINNYKLKFKTVKLKNGAWVEFLPLKGRNKIYTIGNNWHFPFIKRYRQNFKRKTLNINDWKEKNKELIGYKISKDMLDENKILEIYKKFNFIK